MSGNNPYRVLHINIFFYVQETRLFTMIQETGHKIMNDIEDVKTQALFNEAGICAHLIGTGLTNIRKAHFMQKAHFGSAFFELTIGIERLCKIILIKRYQKNNSDAFPTNEYIRKFSHEICSLIHEVVKNNKTEFIEKDNIADAIIRFLSEFAKTTRYYNLDSITGTLPKEKDPLVMWNKIAEEIIKRHYKDKKFSLTENKMIELVQENASFLYHDLNGNLIDNARDFFYVGRTAETVQKYSVYYLYGILKDLLNVVHKEEDEYYSMPLVSEFFPFFYDGALTKREILLKKNWIYK